MKRAGGLQFIVGVIIGALVFGGGVAVATGIMAQPKTADVVIDGRYVDLTGYIIGGAHYFQLRDLDEKLVPGGKDFSVVWDGANNRIIIDTTRSYDPNETIETIRINALLAEYASEVVRLTNIERANAGLPPLAVSDNLMELAKIKSQDMADNLYLAHDSPTFGRTRDLLDRSIWSRFMGENCAGGQRTPEEVVGGWMYSEGHRANILNAETTHFGVGVAVNRNGALLWTQVFAIAR